MTYTPTPYSEATPVSAKTLRAYHEHEVSLEIDNPEDPEGDLIEVEFSLFFTVQPAEPDVGIMSEYIDDWFYANGDGSTVPEGVWVEIDKIGHRVGDWRSDFVSKRMENWHERNIEAALESDGDYGDW